MQLLRESEAQARFDALVDHGAVHDSRLVAPALDGIERRAVEGALRFGALDDCIARHAVPRDGELEVHPTLRLALARALRIARRDEEGPLQRRLRQHGWLRL